MSCTHEALILKPVTRTSAAFLLHTPHVQSLPSVVLRGAEVAMTRPCTVKKKEPSSSTPRSVAAAAAVEGLVATLLHCYIYARSTMSGVQLR
jgi:hypothetical protein